MDTSKDRVLAYDLATMMDPVDLEDISGGHGTAHMPTVQPTGDIMSLDMTLDY